MKGLMMKYFVLKPAGDSPYHTASRKAMKEYAKSIMDENHELAMELLEWCHKEDMAHFDRTHTER